jgi:hypothetical protein
MRLDNTFSKARCFRGLQQHHEKQALGACFLYRKVLLTQVKPAQTAI